MPGPRDLNTEVFAVVSNYNTDPTWIQGKFSEFVILDQSDRRNNWHVDWEGNPKFRSSPHVGHNLLDYFNWIVLNWDQIPQWVLLAKGNMIPRHISTEDLERVLGNRIFSPCWTHTHVINSKNAFVDSMGVFQEFNNDWYVPYKQHRYFVSLDVMAHFLFKNYVSMPYIGFSPGALWLLSKENVQLPGLTTYKALIEVLSYGFFPAEAYMVERLLGGIFSGNLELRDEWKNTENLKRAFLQLPDLSNKYISPPGLLSKYRSAIRIFRSSPRT
jgi:hypothetical protein